MRSWKHWSPEEENILRREWARGTQIKVIAHMVEHPPSSVKERRRLLNLPPRHWKGKRRETVKIQLDPSLLQVALGRASVQGNSFSTYIRKLIERDTGAFG